jgi:hypothetical protein
MAGASYPAITQLEVEVTTNFDPDVILGISIALKPTLKLFSLHNFVHETDAQPLLPVYETLRENIEGLSVTDSCSLSPILHFCFPKLRVLAIHGWLDSLVDLLTQGIFSQSPIDTIAINSSIAMATPDHLKFNTLSHVPHLRKLVWMNIKPYFSPPRLCLAACEAHHIKYIYLCHDKLSQIMVSHTHR